jgi:hypothetical protein
MITFKTHEQGQWVVANHLRVNPAEPSEVERLAKKYARNQHAIFYDKNLRVITLALASVLQRRMGPIPFL